jgi:hypothetical protein
VNPLHRLADYLLQRSTRVPPAVASSHYRKHRDGFVRGWTCCLLTVAALYVLRFACLAILNTPLPPLPPAP